MNAFLFRDNDGTWGIIRDDDGFDVIVLRGESFTVAEKIAHAINIGAVGTSEADEVARAILKAAGEDT